MPKVLITGNGFDLHYGLPTYYSDFIRILAFIEKTQKTDFDSIYSNCYNYEGIKDNFNSFELDINQIENIRELIKINQWYQLFKDEFEIETWIDFESKIEYVLNTICNSIESIKNQIFLTRSIRKNELSHSTGILNRNIEVIKLLNKLNIISHNESSRIRLNKDYLIEKHNYYIDIHTDKIIQYLNNELTNFKKIFNHYFEIFIYPFYKNSKETINPNLFSSIDKHYTFNYTPTFDTIFNRTNFTSYLHGKIDSTLNKIVLGISEIPENNLDNKHLILFTKTFQKLNNKTDYLFLKELEKQKNDNHIFFFWGHSLDKSDEKYINEVFEFAKNSHSKTKTIVVAYHNEKSRSQLLINLINIRKEEEVEKLMKDKILIFEKIGSTELENQFKKDIKIYPFDATGIY